MDLREFHNGLRLLTSLDQWEVGLQGKDWQAFRTDPFRYFVRADDATALRIWGAMRKRMPAVADASLEAVTG